MALTRNFSVVADSTLASSPPSLVSSPVPIKRTARTYGRRRDELDDPLLSEQGSRDNILLTGPQNLSDEIPPSEPSGSVDSDEGGINRDVSSSSFRQPNIGFGWREKMREIDGIDDLSSYVLTRDTSEHASEFPSTTSLMDNHPDFQCKAESSSDGSPGNVSPDSLSLLTTILQPTSGDLSCRVSSSRALSTRLRIQKNMLISENVLQNEDKRPICPSSPRSPSPHPLTTPNSRRTSSPPTSHHDAISVPSSASKQTMVPLSSGEEHTRSSEDAAQSHGKLDPREKKGTIKPLTRKERREIARERARLAAGQEISINKITTQEKSIRTLLSGVQAKLLSCQPQTSKQLNSPFNDFPGSQPHLLNDTKTLSTSMEESGSDGPSNIGTIPGTKGNPTEKANSKEQALRDHKLRILQTQSVATHDDASDSDLEVGPPTKLEQQRKLAEQRKVSYGQRMFMKNAHAPTQEFVLNPRATTEELEVVQDQVMKTGIRDPKLFHLWIRQVAEKDNMKQIKRKEEMWKRLGGTVQEHRTSASMSDAMENQIRQRLDVWAKQAEMKEIETSHSHQIDDEEENSDWTPETRGSTSPVHKDEHTDYERMELGEMNDDLLEDQNAQEANSNGDQSDDEESLVSETQVKFKRRHCARIVDSEQSDSEEYDVQDSSIRKPRVDHYLVSSSDDRTEDENDKENDTRLMFDHSEDKENKAVTRHEPLSNRSISDEQGYDSSPSPPHISSRSLEHENWDSSQITTSSCGKRQPFSVILDASPSLPRRQPSSLTQVFATQLNHSSQIRKPIEDDGEEDVFGSTPLLAPVFGGENTEENKKPAPPGFSQFSPDGSGSICPAPLQPGFSDLFESGTQENDADGALLQGLRQKPLGLTQDLILQPAFQVDDKLLRKADAIFEKEQRYIVEAASKKATKAPQFFVNEVGLLTQTKPSASRFGTRSPSFVFSPMRTQSQNVPSSSLAATQIRRPSSDLTQRAPLSTISLSDTLNSPEASPKGRRIYRRRSTPISPTGGFSLAPVNDLVPSASPLRRPLDAFQVLGKRAANAKAKGKTEFEKTIRKEYLNDEAEESDEDRMVGFGFRKEDEEEGEEMVGEDWDAHLAELVDDQKMDEKTEAVDRVLEKHQKLMEEDDQKLEELHKRAVQGELRRKRKRNGLGMDDSDEEDEEQDSKLQRLRKKMKSKVERGDIQELASSEDTAAFAKIYQNGLVDEEMIETRPLDLEHEFNTNYNSEDEDVAMSDGQEYEREDREEGSEAESEDEEDVHKNRSFISYREIQQEVRRIKEQPQEVNYNSSSWIDEQIDGPDGNEDSLLKVSLITNSSKRNVLPIKSEWDSIMLGGSRKKENAEDVARSRQWAKEESRKIHGLTGRKVGGIAVTGYGNKTKTGGGSLRSKTSVGNSVATPGNGAGKNSLKAEDSVLARIGRRDIE